MSSFPSTYIPTTTTAVARNADMLTYSAVGVADSFPLTVSLEETPNASTPNRYVIALTDGTNSNRVAMYSSTGNVPIMIAVDGGASQGTVTGPDGMLVGSTYKRTMVANTNDLELYQDGASVGTPDTSAVMPDVTLIEIGNTGQSVFQPYSNIRNIKIHNKRLTDAQVAAL